MGNMTEFVEIRDDSTDSRPKDAIGQPAAPDDLRASVIHLTALVERIAADQEERGRPVVLVSERVVELLDALAAWQEDGYFDVRDVIAWADRDAHLDGLLHAALPVSTRMLSHRIGRLLRDLAGTPVAEFMLESGPNRQHYRTYKVVRLA